MKEGYWINYKTKKVFEINEHELWIRNINNATKISLSEKTIDSFDKFKSGKDRDSFLIYVMRENPVMRVRGHGASITFEFNSKVLDDALQAIGKFCKDENIGDYMMLNVFNFENNKRFNCLYKDWDASLKSGMIARKFMK